MVIQYFIQFLIPFAMICLTAGAALVLFVNSDYDWLDD